MTDRSIQAIVRGRVQGVGFRWFVREAAVALDLAGQVRNRPDGSVEVMASGAVDRIAALLERLREGPAGATVSGVEIEDRSDLSALSRPFTIAR